MKQVNSLFLILLLGSWSAAVTANECVVLLHGWGQITNSMGELEKKVTRAGYTVFNIRYATRHDSLAVMAEEAVARGVAACRDSGSGTIHFVTHSLGGILLRHYLENDDLNELGRVVMLAPPNQGSEVVQRLSGLPGFKFLVGPAADALGTGEDSVATTLGPIDFDLGIIAGTTSVNPLNLLFPIGPNDSLVSVESTRIEGMNAHLVLPVSHQLMMRNNEVIDNTIHFLKTGVFISEE